MLEFFGVDEHPEPPSERERPLVAIPGFEALRVFAQSPAADPTAPRKIRYLVDDHGEGVVVEAVGGGVLSALRVDAPTPLHTLSHFKFGHGYWVDFDGDEALEKVLIDAAVATRRE